MYFPLNLCVVFFQTQLVLRRDEDLYVGGRYSGAPTQAAPHFAAPRDPTLAFLINSDLHLPPPPPPEYMKTDILTSPIRLSFVTQTSRYIGAFIEHADQQQRVYSLVVASPCVCMCVFIKLHIN